MARFLKNWPDPRNPTTEIEIMFVIKTIERYARQNRVIYTYDLYDNSDMTYLQELTDEYNDWYEQYPEIIEDESGQVINVIDRFNLRPTYTTSFSIDSPETSLENYLSITIIP